MSRKTALLIAMAAAVGTSGAISSYETVVLLSPSEVVRVSHGRVELGTGERASLAATAVGLHLTALVYGLVGWPSVMMHVAHANDRLIDPHRKAPLTVGGGEIEAIQRQNRRILAKRVVVDAGESGGPKRDGAKRRENERDSSRSAARARTGQ